MTIEMLNERIAKAEEKLQKKQNTIVKKTKLIEKKTATIPTLTDEFNMKMMQSEIYWLNDDIKNLNKQIATISNTIEKYKKQLDTEIAKNTVYTNDIPEQFKELEKSLVEEWNRWDLERKEFLMEKRNTMDYFEFIKKFSHSEYDLCVATEEDINKNNIKLAKDLINDLYNRIKHITGQVTSWNNIKLTIGTHGFPVLNGTVAGKNGTANVNSIYAGGYNIQRLHIRVLVTSI